MLRKQNVPSLYGGKKKAMKSKKAAKKAIVKKPVKKLQAKK